MKYIGLIKIPFYVSKGFFHTLRVALYRSMRLPYAWLKSSGIAKFSTDQAWPQPSPISSKMPYAVLHLPAEEIKEFIKQIVSRFQRQVTFSWISAIQYLTRKPYLECPNDPTFVSYMTETVFAYFFTDTLSTADKEVLEANGISSQSVHKSDLAPVSTVETFKGFYCTGSACYFREDAQGKYEILGITMVDKDLRLHELIRPHDGSNWQLAKMHALQGATYLSLFVTHPKCHFPMDAVIAVTKTFLPKEHKVNKLLIPHFYLQLPLDYSVLHIKNGPAYNDPRLYYTAFSGAGRSQYRLFEHAFDGLPGHAAFPPYSFGHLLKAKRTGYMNFLFGYYDVILGFVRKVVAEIETDDVLLEWARHCANYSKGFIGPEKVADKEQLSACLAYVLWNCSVVHSADHWDIHAISMEHKPTRLRVPPPFKKVEFVFDVRKLMNLNDRLRQFMWHELYLRHWLLKRLCDVDYEFAEEGLRAASQEFMEQLKAYDENQPTKRYIPLKEICSSIHF